MKYLNRTADILLKEKLDAFGAVLIEGPKWCGKTTTATQQAKSILALQDVDMQENYRKTATVKPSILLKGENPRLIDEWQDIPVLWDAVRNEVDKRGEAGLFILTGSNAVDQTKIKHTGTGRISRMKMYPMSLFESKESNGKISISELFNNPNLDIDGIESDLSVEELVFAACRGGWPISLNRKTDKAKLMIASDYIDSVCKSDISRIDGTKRNENIARLIIKSFARNISTLAKKSNILKDVRAQVETLADNTMDDYLEALEKLFVIENVEPWSPAIRSASSIRKGLKLEFTDPSIAVAALGLSPEMLNVDMKTFGFIFETLCIRDLRAYTQSLGGRMAYYHDRNDLEADGVLHLNDGRYALIEFKLGSDDVEKGAEHLLKIKKLVKEYNNKLIRNSEGNSEDNRLGAVGLLREPDLMMVVTGGKMAYRTEEGVNVIPIGCLKD